MIDLLSESEAARVLKCTAGAVRRLRVARQLAFIPLRPVLIERIDLEALVEDRKFAARLKALPGAMGPPSPLALEHAAAKLAELRWLRQFASKLSHNGFDVEVLGLRECRGVWHLRYKSDGRIRSICTRQTTRLGADVFRDVWRDRAKAAAAAKRRLATCAVLWTAYMREHVEKNCSVPVRHDLAWAKLEPRFGALRPCDVTPELVQAHVQARLPTKPSTVFVELSYLMASWEHARNRRVLHAGDFPDRSTLDLPKPPPRRERWLRKEEVERLLVAAEEIRKGPRLSRLERFIHIASKTGARRTAILELRWPQVDFEARVVHFNPEGRAQTKKRRASVPMTPGLLAILEIAHRERINDLVLDHSRRMPDALRAAGRRAGVSGVTHHVFRHTVATQLARKGLPLWKISKILGTTLDEIEQTYAHHAPDDLRDAVEALDVP